MAIDTGNPFGGFGGFGGGMRMPSRQMPSSGGYYGSGWAGGMINRMPSPQMPRRMPGGPSKGGTTSIQASPSRGGAPWGGYNPNAGFPGGPGKARNRGQSRGGSWFGGGFPGGPGKGRSQDPFGRQMQPQQFDQVGNNPPPPPPQLEMVGNNPVSTPTGGQDTSTDYSSYLDFYNNRNFQLKPVGNNPPPQPDQTMGRPISQPFQPAVDLSSKQRGGPRFGINMPPPPQATTGDYQYSSLFQGPIRQEPMTGNQGFGNLQPMPYQPDMSGNTNRGGTSWGSQPMPMHQPNFGQIGRVENNPPQVDLSQHQRPIYSGGPYVPDFGQKRSQGPMNMPQSPFMGYQGQMGGQPQPFGLQHIQHPTQSGGFYGGGITDLYPR